MEKPQAPEVLVPATQAPNVANSFADKGKVRSASKVAAYGAWGGTEPDSSEEGAASRPGSRQQTSRPGSRQQPRPDSRQSSSRPGRGEGWSRGSLQGKTSVPTIATPHDGLLGIVTEIPLDRGHSRGSSRLRAGTESKVSSRPNTAHASEGRLSSHRRSTSTPNGDLRRRRVHADPGFVKDKRNSTADVLSGEDDRRVVSCTDMICCSRKSKELLPYLPFVNVFGMTTDNPVRAMAVRLAVNWHLEMFWIFTSFVHYLIMSPEIQDNVFGCILLRDLSATVKECKYSVPHYYHLIFLALFTLEAAIKVVGLGMTGGRFSWWTHDLFNKCDIIAYLAYIYETFSSLYFNDKSTLSLRALRLIRILQPISQLGVFSDIETIFTAIARSLLPMATVLLFIWFILILFGIMGMSFWGRAAFRRRCIWADILEPVIPEKFCKRSDYYYEYPDCLKLISDGNMTTANEPCYRNPLAQKDRMGFTMADGGQMAAALDNSCGPLQLCVDLANPNSGFGSFDHLPSAVLVLFTVLSGDGDIDVLWRGIESEPAMKVLVLLYFLVFAFLVIHVLINILVAVFANIFSETRSENEEKIEKRRQGFVHKHGSDTSSSAGFSDTSSMSSEFFSPQSREHDILKIDEEEPEQPDGEKKQEAPTEPSAGDDQSSPEDQKPQDEKNNSSELAPEQKAAADKADTTEKNPPQEMSPASPVERDTSSLQWILKHLHKEADPSVQRFTQYIVRNPLYDTMTFVIILTQIVALILIGQLCVDCFIDRVLEDLVRNCNYFFFADMILVTICEGSIANYFKSGENTFNCIITFLTTLALAFSLLGLDKENVAVLTGFTIFRVLRMCKYFFLKPIWLMFIKTTGQLIAVGNLVLFNIIVTVIYYSIGRSVFGDTLSDNDLFNYSSMSRGYMLLFTVITGDGWSGFMWEGMATFCDGDQVGDYCDYPKVTLVAFFYILWFCYGQYLFINMFLAIILEAFSVDEFMTVEEKEEERPLNREEARKKVAEFQQLPEWAVHKSLIKLAFLKLAEGNSRVDPVKIITFTRMVQPLTTWRFLKYSGIIAMRQLLRQTFCSVYASTWLAPYPGDDDCPEPEEDAQKITVDVSLVEVEAKVASKLRIQIQDYMRKLTKLGMAGEVFTVAKRLDHFDQLDLKDLGKTDTLIAMQLLRDKDLATRLGIVGHYDAEIQAEFTKNVTASSTLQDALKEAEENTEYKGLNLAALEQKKVPKYKDVDSFDIWIQYFVTKFQELSFVLVQNSAYGSLTLANVVVSSVFLCLETPDTIEGPLQPSVLFLADFIFNALFLFESATKIGAFGFNRPRNVNFPSYMQSVQNQVDLGVLLFAVADMSGAGRYIGENTTKVIRLMKVMRPIRLLLRSPGLKSIIEALVQSLKPMGYATLFLLIICLLFSVTGMAFFRKRFEKCNDMSLDGLAGEGKVECSGIFFDDENGFHSPRVWAGPPFANHFDTLGSSVAVLVRCLTLSWVATYEYAQDAYQIDIQPVSGINIVTASLYFHFFLLTGSFFGLNLFASFMCDTFYTLQGTAQLEEVMWNTVKKTLAANRPTVIIHPPKNFLSTLLRQILASSQWNIFSSFCMLCNTTFMGSTHADENDQTIIFLDVQNTVFFAIMCTEAGLHLLSLGPRLYVVNPQNQFDLILITATSLTMIFSESLRSLSQVTRMLRLFKFIRSFARDKTIANTFETVMVSVGQVMNIVIVLVVILIMLAVLAVKMFGLVKPGNRLGSQANFQTFANSAQTIFQLMFGEDMPTLWDDCSIQPPSCTPDIFDERGKIFFKSDCGSGFATVFFPTVLVLTNYVVLNLFVGMIMNNFAYICSRENNDTIGEKQFEEAAHKYVTDFDPKCVGQIHLSKVYPLYNILGEPLGNYGTTQNWGRFLCIRSDLKRICEADEQTKFSRWCTYVHLPLLDYYKGLYEQRSFDWRNGKEILREVESKLREVVGDDKELMQELEELGLVVIKQGGAANADTSRDNATDLKGIDGDEGGDEAGDGHEGDDVAETFQKEKDTKKAVIVNGGNMGQPRKPDQIWISGGNMGSKKVSKKQLMARKSARALDKQMADAAVKALENKQYGEAGGYENVKKKAEIEELKARLFVARAEAKKPEPTPTIKMKLIGVVVKISNLFLSQRERKRRLPGHIFYDEIILAMLYWNKEKNIIPTKVIELRKDQDEAIKYEVATQMIQAVCHGGIVRYRKRVELKKIELQKRLKQAQKMVLLNTMLHEKGSPFKDKLRRKKLAPIQEDFAKRGRWVEYMDNPDIGPLKMLCCKLVKYQVAGGFQLADAVEECSVKVGEEGIFELDEETLATCFQQSEYLSELQARMEAVERIKMLTTTSQSSDVAASYFQLAGQIYGVNFGPSFEHLSKIPAESLHKIMQDRCIQMFLQTTEIASKLPTGPAGPDTANTALASIPEEDEEKLMKRIEAEENFYKELRRLKQEYLKHEQQHKELHLVIEATSQRASSIEAQLEQQRAVIKHVEAASEDMDEVEHVHILPEDGSHHQMRELVQNQNLPEDSRARRTSSSYEPQHAITAAKRNATQTLMLPGQQAELEHEHSMLCRESSIFSIAESELSSSIQRYSSPCEQVDVFEESTVGLSSEGELNRSYEGHTTMAADLSEHEERLATSLRIAQAEMQRLERLLSKAKSQKNAATAARSAVVADPEWEKRMAEARARKAAKEEKSLEVDSDSAISGLMSPRDKALKAQIKKKEALKKEKAKQAAENERQRKIAQGRSRPGTEVQL